MSDCEACEARTRAEYHFGRGEDELGMAELAATLDGRSTCDEEPHASQSVALLPLVRLGRTDEARGAHLASYRAVRGREAYLASVGRHLEFCALTGNEARGLELLAQNRALFGFTAAPLDRLEFLTKVEVLLRRLAAVGHADTPCGGPLGREWTVAELLESVAADAAGFGGAVRRAERERDGFEAAGCAVGASAVGGGAESGGAGGGFGGC